MTCCFRIRHSHGATGCESAHNPFRSSRAQSLNHPALYPPGILPIPPAQALLDQHLVEVRTIRQDHFSNRALVHVFVLSVWSLTSFP